MFHWGSSAACSCFALVRPCVQGRCGRWPLGFGVISDLFFLLFSFVPHVPPLQVLTPMAILSTLQRSSTLTLDVAKDFIQQYVRRQQNKAEFHGGKISQLQAETAQLEESVRRKRSEPFVRPRLPSAFHTKAAHAQICTAAHPVLVQADVQKPAYGTVESKVHHTFALISTLWCSLLSSFSLARSRSPLPHLIHHRPQTLHIRQTPPCPNPAKLVFQLLLMRGWAAASQRAGVAA